MSTVAISPDKVFEAVLNAIIAKERELERIEQVIVKKYRKGWLNNWRNKKYTDKEIVDSSLDYGFQRCRITGDINKLEALSNMCTHAIQEGTTIALYRKDYELIYGDN